MKLPSFQFYPGDWMKDPNLRRCSRAARGLWADMLCLMFECEDRGVLSTGGEPWCDEDIAAASGGDIAEGLSCISELLRKGVARRNQAGAIFSKRMVEDERIRRERIKAGSVGGSKSQANRKQTGEQNQTPSSSPSSSKKTHTRAREALPPQENQAVAIFTEVYEATPDIFSQERIEAEVKDCEVWRQVLTKSRSNGIPATKVGTALDIYKDKMNEKTNGKTKRDATFGAL